MSPGFWIDEGRLPFCRRLHSVVIGSGETNGPGFVARPLGQPLRHRSPNTGVSIRIFSDGEPSRMDYGPFTAEPALRWGTGEEVAPDDR